jgi:hypothetical protein
MTELRFFCKIFVEFDVPTKLVTNNKNVFQLNL